MMTLDRARFRLVGPAGSVDLTPQEFELAACLSQHPGHVKTRQQIMDAAYGRATVDERTIDTLVRRFRRKAERLGEQPIGTRSGFGYYWKDGTEA